MILVHLECLSFWYFLKSSSIILNIRFRFRVSDEKADRLNKFIYQLIFLWLITIFYVLSKNCAETVNNPNNRISTPLSVLIWKQKDYSDFLCETKNEEFVY